MICMDNGAIKLFNAMFIFLILEPLGDDDYEYYDDIYEGETRCSVFGECCIADDGSGMTANEAW